MLLDQLRKEEWRQEGRTELCLLAAFPLLSQGSPTRAGVIRLKMPTVPGMRNPVPASLSQSYHSASAFCTETNKFLSLGSPRSRHHRASVGRSPLSLVPGWHPGAHPLSSLGFGLSGVSFVRAESHSPGTASCDLITPKVSHPRTTASEVRISASGLYRDTKVQPPLHPKSHGRCTVLSPASSGRNILLSGWCFSLHKYHG